MRKSTKTPSRDGKIGATIYFDPRTHRALKRLAFTHDTTITALLREGVNMMLSRYGQKPTA